MGVVSSKLNRYFSRLSQFTSVIFKFNPQFDFLCVNLRFKGFFELRRLAGLKYKV